MSQRALVPERGRFSSPLTSIGVGPGRADKIYLVSLCSSFIK